MRLDEAQKILEAEIVVDANLQSIEVEMGCGADLMSDVLSFAKKDALLLTGLTNTRVWAALRAATYTLCSDLL